MDFHSGSTGSNFHVSEPSHGGQGMATLKPVSFHGHEVHFSSPEAQQGLHHFENDKSGFHALVEHLKPGEAAPFTNDAGHHFEFYKHHDGQIVLRKPGEHNS